MNNKPVASLSQNISRFRRSRSGLAALEFSFIAPVMIFLFFVVVEGSDAISAGRRVTLGANTLADLVSQAPSVSAADLNGLFQGIETIIGSSDADSTLRVVSIEFDDAQGQPAVVWSRDDDGGEPYAPGTPYTQLTDATVLDDTETVIIAEVQFAYKSNLTKVLIDNITMDRAATRWPRNASGVSFCSASCN
ncbi:MAG: TadE/TadG family type IV pilus assembly protein [Pseudomonadota bacterium]